MIQLHVSLPSNLISRSALIISVDETKLAHPCILVNGSVKELRARMPHLLRNHPLTQQPFLVEPEKSPIKQMVVVFDCFGASFSSLVKTCLQAASAAGLKSVILPAGLRMGIMAQDNKKDHQVDELLNGIAQAKVSEMEINLFFPYSEISPYLRDKLQKGQHPLAA